MLIVIRSLSVGR